jgi:hypothetical protein
LVLKKTNVQPGRRLVVRNGYHEPRRRSGSSSAPVPDPGDRGSRTPFARVDDEITDATPGLGLHAP